MTMTFPVYASDINTLSNNLTEEDNINYAELLEVIENAVVSYDIQDDGSVAVILKSLQDLTQSMRFS